MATIREVREGLAEYISELTGLECKPYLPPQVNPPMACIMFGSPYIKYGIVMGDGFTQVTAPVELNLSIMVIISLATGYDSAQQNLDQWLDHEPNDDFTSVIDALGMDPTIGGLVEYVEPTTVPGYEVLPIAGQQYFLARVNVVVSVAQDIGV